jgi:LacI family gluconate utilization system Gnt-I transcriptional repressor
MLDALLSRRPEAIIMVGAPVTGEGSAMLQRAHPRGRNLGVAGDTRRRGSGLRQSRRRQRRGLAILPEPVGAAWSLSAAMIAGRRGAGHGFVEAAGEAGLAEPRRVLVEWQSGSRAGAAVLVSTPDADAVFAANDAYAIGLLSALRGADRLGPASAAARPVAVVGLGDLEMGRLFSPTASTIRIGRTAIGRAAAELALDPAKPRRIDLGFELVLRESG